MSCDKDGLASFDLGNDSLEVVGDNAVDGDREALRQGQEVLVNVLVLRLVRRISVIVLLECRRAYIE